jgi:hypothetical protein
MMIIVACDRDSDRDSDRDRDRDRDRVGDGGGDLVKQSLTNAQPSSTYMRKLIGNIHQMRTVSSN